MADTRRRAAAGMAGENAPEWASTGAAALAGASVLIAGGGSGIGRAVAGRLITAGARVTICGRRSAVIAETASALGGNCQPVRADISNDEGRETALEAARANGGPVAALVHCAADLVPGPIGSLERDTALRVFDNNVVSALMLVADALPDLEKTRGSIVLFSSSHTERASPNLATYAASKGAIEAATAALAVELGPAGIRVNCVRPGAVPTEILRRSGLDAQTAATRLESLAPKHALGRLGTCDEVAHGVEYLLTASWTTGIVLGVDGGFALGM